MASSKRLCRRKVNRFCYVCGEYTLSHDRNPVTSFIRRAYRAYFGIKLGDQDHVWVPHTVCKVCVKALRGWTKGKSNLKFGIPMLWREPTNHVTDCYFCAVDVTGFNRKNRSSLKYPDLQSARRPKAHCDEIPVPIFGELPNISDEDTSSVKGHEEDKKEVVCEYDTPYLFSHKELNDLLCDLRFSKDSAELLASRLKERNFFGSALKRDLPASELSRGSKKRKFKP